MNNKKYKIISGGVLVIALVAMIGIVYAAYSQTLNINGDATVKANSWNVHFDDFHGSIIEAQLTGEAKQLTAPTIKNNSTTIGDYSVLLSKPGDSVKYSFRVRNDGTFNAMLDVIKIPTPICTGTGESAEDDAAKVCKHLKYHFSSQDFDDVTAESLMYYLDSNGKLDREALASFGFSNVLEHLLYTGESEYYSIMDGGLYLELTYDNEIPSEDLPKNDVAISNLGVELIFTQVD